MDYNQLGQLNGLETRINIALINWDPIEIQKSGEFAHNVYLEYSRYIPEIISSYGEGGLLESLVWRIAKDVTGCDEKDQLLSQEVTDLLFELRRIFEEENHRLKN